MIEQSHVCASFTSRKFQTLEPIRSLYHKGFDIRFRYLTEMNLFGNQNVYLNSM